jgi:maltooligosyltrehalose synthase
MGLIDPAADGWGLLPAASETSVELPDGTWRDEISGRELTGTVSLADLLAVLPAALLTRLRR